MKYITLHNYVPLTKLNYNPNGKDDIKFQAYKQFKTLYNPLDKNTFKYKGELFPLYVNGDNNGSKDSIKVGDWYRCGQGELLGAVDDSGNEILDKRTGKQKVSVKSKLGPLSYRPGWHCGSLPLTRHIGINAMKDEFGNVVNDKDGHPIHATKDYIKNHPDLYKSNDYEYMKSQCVWALVEFSGHYDATKDSNGNGIKDFRDNPNEKYKDSYYYFKTNTNASDDENWIIADAIKVIKVLNDNEVSDIAGSNAQKRFYPDGSDNNKFSADFSQFSEMFENIYKNCN